MVYVVYLIKLNLQIEYLYKQDRHYLLLVLKFKCKPDKESSRLQVMESSLTKLRGSTPRRVATGKTRGPIQRRAKKRRSLSILTSIQLRRNNKLLQRFALNVMCLSNRSRLVKILT